MADDSLAVDGLNSADLVKRYFSDQKYCMAYDKSSCSGNIIQAHTISQRYLKNACTDGHVYIPIPSSHRDNGFYEFERKGLKTVTCISGFCKHHDAELFRSFEQADYNGSYTQIYGMSFRAICRELYQKRNLNRLFERVSVGDLQHLDKKGFTRSVMFKTYKQHLISEVIDHKFLYNQMRRYTRHGISYMCVTLPKIPIQTTGVIFPLYLSNGEKIQNENRKQLGFVYNLFSGSNESYLIISSVNSLHNNVHKRFLASLLELKCDFLIDYLLTYFFYNNDNITINPAWFDTLHVDVKRGLYQLIEPRHGSYGKVTGFLGVWPFCQEIGIVGAEKLDQDYSF